MTDALIIQIAANPRAVLNRGYRAQQRIIAREERIRKWRDMSVSITANPENASSGNSFACSKIENCVAAITELQEQLAEEIRELTQLELETAQAIELFSSKPNYKTVLELRYLNHMTFEEISVNMNYTFRWTQELLKKALKDMRANAASACDRIAQV